MHIMLDMPLSFSLFFFVLVCGTRAKENSKSKEKKEKKTEE
jgi:hypothetical protein